MMHPLNPFLRAFFASPLCAQCAPISQHVLLVPTTELLLQSKDRDTNTSYAELAATEDFLASHVLRIVGAGPQAEPPKDGSSVREGKGRARQYTTLNGRTIIIKDAFVYSNKGFKTLNQAQLIGDTIYYPDVPDGQQWLVYYISRPLIGTCHPSIPPPAMISDEPSKERKKLLAEATEQSAASTSGANNALVKKKDVKSFSDLLGQFPVIARQMSSGLERITREFVAANEKPAPPLKRTRSSSESSQRSVRTLSDVASIRSSRSGIGGDTVHPTSLELEREESDLRSALETAIVAAIDLFQNVDKQQLSLLGASTELTGPMIERMIERYVAEQVYDRGLFPSICAVRNPDDLDLDSRIRKMTDIDIAQVGIPIENGMRGKRVLAARLAKGINAFKRMEQANSPQEMLEILLSTQKLITEDAAGSEKLTQDASGEVVPATPLTINADILVSLLLVVVIRSGVKYLHSRLVCMRYFILIDEVETGEQGYALATLEAVLAHLMSGSSTLRKASKYNRVLWQAVRSGDVTTIRSLIQPDALLRRHNSTPGSVSNFREELTEDDASLASGEHTDDDKDVKQNSDALVSQQDFVAVNGSLQHIFPFQKPPTPPPEQVTRGAKKRVSLASLPRSYSGSSAYSSQSHSRNMSVDSNFSNGLGADLSAEVLAQTQDRVGDSLLMMAVEAGQIESLEALLAMSMHFQIATLLEDMNDAGVSLLIAAIQAENKMVLRKLVDHLESNASLDALQRYFRLQDGNGRCFAHYLFHEPSLIARFGYILPWRLKDKNGQTPLFALCRSYDHQQYRSMIDTAIVLATKTQDDGEPLHLDDHVDAKGNTLLHIINDASIATQLLNYCDSDVNATNDKRFTPIMTGSKYGRIDLVRTLFDDARVDITLRETRGFTTVELAKDDEVRNCIDDMVLLTASPGRDGRMTSVVRALFVEDSTIRLILKSGAPNPNGTVTVTTCRRSAGDFESLSQLLGIECPASWLPNHFNLPSPYLIQSRPSRAVLRDTQLRLDNFFSILLTHGTFSTHELVWEFFLVPDIDMDLLAERSKRKAETRVENVKDDFEPVTETQEVENFVAFARDQVKGVTSATRKVIRCVNKHRMLRNDLAEAQTMASAAVSSLLFLPTAHAHAYERYSKGLVPSEASPMVGLYYSLHSVVSTSTAIQVATNRPAYLIGSMSQAQRAIDRSMGSISRSNRWTPRIGLFEDAKRAITLDAWHKAAKARAELDALGSELRYTQQTIASELAAWQDEHISSGREMLRKLAQETITKEKDRLQGMLRALREARNSSSG